MGLFDSLGSALGVAGSSLVSPVFSLASGLLGNKMSADRQEAANEFSASQFATRYQTTTKDMQAAGLNPMLAYSQGGGNAPSSAIASANMPDIGSSFSQSRIASAQEANLAAQTRKTNAEANVVEQTGIDSAKASISNLLSQSGLNLEMQGRVMAETEKIGSEIRNLQSTDQQIHAMISNLAEQNKLLKAQGIESAARAAMLGAQARLISAEARIQGFNIDAIIQSGGVGRLAREVKPISDIANDWVETAKFWKTKTKNTTGTIFDREGNVSGGYSRSTTER